MEEAAKKATSFAQHQGEEQPLYKEYIPHTSEQQVIIDKLISDDCEVLRDTLPAGISPV